MFFKQLEKHFSKTLKLDKKLYSNIKLISKKKDDIRVKATFRCPQEYRKDFKNSKVILPISVDMGHDVHEGEKFEATLNLVNKFFSGCILLIGDTAQRWTKNILRKGTSLVSLREETLIEGNDWLNRNKSAIDKLTIPKKILTSDQWLDDKDFSNWRDNIEYLYFNNDEYKKKIDETINELLTRLQKKHEKFQNQEEYERAFGLCKAYLFEKRACMCLWVKEPYMFAIFPTEQNLAMTATYEHFIQPTYPNLLKSVLLKFKERQAVKNNIIITENVRPNKSF